MNWPSIRATIFKNAQMQWIPEQYRKQKFFYNYLQENFSEWGPALEEFGVSFLKAASANHPIDAVLSGNIDYWQDETMKLACRALGIPFLVLCRENYTIAQEIPFLVSENAKAKFQYSGDGVAVFSQATADAMVISKSCKAEVITITGAPRYDRWLDLSPPRVEECNKITLLSYFNPLYMASENFAEVLKLCHEAAGSSLSKSEIILKCKNADDERHIRTHFPYLEQTPLEISHAVELFHLLPRSKIIIGFNSLAVLEGLLTDAAIAVPNWGDAVHQKPQLLLHPDDPLDKSVIHFPRSPGELFTLMVRAQNSQLPPLGTKAARRALFSRHLHLPEGETACANVEAFVRKHIEKAKMLRQNDL